MLRGEDWRERRRKEEKRVHNRPSYIPTERCKRKEPRSHGVTNQDGRAMLAVGDAWGLKIMGGDRRREVQGTDIRLHPRRPCRSDGDWMTAWERKRKVRHGGIVWPASVARLTTACSRVWHFLDLTGEVHVMLALQFRAPGLAGLYRDLPVWAVGVEEAWFRPLLND